MQERISIGVNSCISSYGNGSTISRGLYLVQRAGHRRADSGTQYLPMQHGCPIYIPVACSRTGLVFVHGLTRLAPIGMIVLSGFQIPAIAVYQRFPAKHTTILAQAFTRRCFNATGKSAQAARKTERKKQNKQRVHWGHTHVPLTTDVPKHTFPFWSSVQGTKN